MNWKDRYLQKAEELQNGAWSEEDRAELRSALHASVLQKAIGRILLDSADGQNRLLSINLGTQEEVVRATKIQGEVLGMIKFQEYLLDLAETEEDKENGRRL